MNEAAGDPGSPIVLCDANVLYSIVMTDLILSPGIAELFCRANFHAPDLPLPQPGRRNDRLHQKI
jgi:hypothetical protein